MGLSTSGIGTDHCPSMTPRVNPVSLAITPRLTRPSSHCAWKSGQPSYCLESYILSTVHGSNVLRQCRGCEVQ